MLFGQSMLNLSGAINVFLFLIIRPNLLLFPPPEMPTELETQMSDPKTSSAILLNTIQYEHSPKTGDVGVAEEIDKRSWNLTFEGFRNSGALLSVGSTQRDV